MAEVKQDSNPGCPLSTCKEQGNYIVIFHEDGTYATYVHFRHEGSLVQPGQTVTKGQPIGYSGNTGWSSGPHLHFEVDTPGEPDKATVPVKFSAGGEVVDQLLQGQRYTW
ncbi:M23 family metallopeptidase [Hymenobacter sp. HSC-4F20]|uniref:M23 family metallopeptidase n=1 Tax=Hymenobacter sp. HSC-4F20 TaxID=2864135 RepID=UPI001C73532C|nr:M23 family metallopeptidase [Hymenobacter sp. HSC-4F20]MBX0289588.1 M23 family metallopeptidase [Hymenobacter sp. HSC-4F20]